MAVHEVDPISRIEGHLGVKLTTDASNIVTDADVHGNLWRGFENFLIGREPNDAITFTQRICGVCPIPHATASTFAVESVLGYNSNFVTYKTDAAGKGVPEKALHIRNLVYASEFIMSAITHFYHLAAPSYVQGPNVPPWTPYFDASYYHAALTNSSAFGTGDLTGGDATHTTMPANAADGLAKDVWSAVIRSYVHALRIRRLTFEAGALFAGRMPMTSSFVAGGVTVNGSESLATKCDKFAALMTEVGKFIIKEYIPIVLALGVLYPEYDNVNNDGKSPFGACLGYGAGVGNFLSWGAFPTMSDTLTIVGAYKLGSAAPVNFNTGKADSAAASTFVQNSLVEHIAHSRYNAYVEPDGAAGYATTTSAAYPGNVSRTVPKRDDATKYSWLKAPRLVISGATHAMEVGPFARLVTNGLYPVNGSTLASVLDLTPLGMADYMDYTKTVDTTTGLDPAMISADIAAPLVDAGLATAYKSGVGTVSDRATAVAHYGDADVCITGPIADWVIGLQGGLSTMDRLRGRGLEALFLIQAMIGGYNKATGTFSGGWNAALKAASGATYTNKAVPKTLKSGFGVSEAPRGALAHFITINNGKIAKYQCVVPTTWNASPKDSLGQNGPMEQAMIGLPFSAAGGSFKDRTGATKTTQGGVEALRIAQSFDPCIACSVH